MSRCFPFPPPGYEKNARVEDIDLLKKEKSKEKKFKKEKKDKEKRESKEKKPKDRSEEKHKEKKDKKVKNREEKKDKDKGKDKPRTSDEKRLLGKTENHNGGNLVHKEHKANDISIFYEKTITGQFAQLIQENHLAEETKRSELVPDNGKAIKGKDVEKFSATPSKRDDRMVRLAGSATSMEVVDKIKDPKIDDRKTDGLGITEVAGFSSSAMVRNPAATVQTGVEPVSKPPLEKKESKPLEKKTERRKETKENIKEGVEGSEKRKEKHKDKDREKKVKTKDKKREKEKRREEKAKEKLEGKRGEVNASKESNKDKFIDGGHSMKASQLAEDGGKSAMPEGNYKKRKDIIETNGFLHTDDIRPIKFQKLSSSSHPISGNGKILEPCQTPMMSALEGQRNPDNLKLDGKERKINGVVEAHPPSSSIKPTATKQLDQMAPPHPDCRYLSQIYSIPKVEEWSDFCDQQWLFNSSNSRERKSNSSEVETIPQVWAEAFSIESADIFALPYVIPY